MSNGKQAKVQKDARDFRRFIEESFPVKEVGEASVREKNIRTGNISSLHIWWARRPLAASRATAYAALMPAPKDAEEWQKKRDFIIQLCQLENSNNQTLLERARREILEANGGVPPKVLDPFSGGGSYPLEALRLGCESYANDYNPVAVLIEKATLEYPQKFGRPFENMPVWANPQRKGTETPGRKGKKGAETQPDLFDQSAINNPQSFNPLLNSVRYWGEWVLEEARKELAEFYPPDPDGSIPVGYIWARTIPCQNPTCGQDIPLMRSFWLAKKANRKIALYPYLVAKKLKFKIVGKGYDTFPNDFDPEEGTVSRAVAACPVCGAVIDDGTVRKLFQAKKSGQTMVAAIMSLGRGDGKLYRVASQEDKIHFENAIVTLTQKRKKLLQDWGMEPVPDESLPVMSGVFNAPIYGISTWGELFNNRQNLSLLVFADIVRKAYDHISQESNKEFAKAVITYIAFVFDKVADLNTSYCQWEADVESPRHLFARQAIPMLWDYAEANPISGFTGSWQSQLKRTLDGFNLISLDTTHATVTQSSATSINYPANYFDAILTDPPYYNSVPYADLSDFFYVWLKRIIGHIYPELFSTPLVPKDKEITEMAGWDPVRYSNKDKNFFEQNLKEAFIEIQRILKPNGIAIIVYAHKSREGWETVINALLDSGLIVTGAYPINTEMKARLRASESAALASSIYIVARKMPRQPTGFYNDVRTELQQHLDAKLHRLWEEGIGGADFFIAAIGSAIEVFGKYEQVMDYEGTIVRADRLLEEVRTIATDYAVRQILHNGFAAEISGLTRLYVLWRWNYGEAIVPFDEARKLSQSCGIDISEAWSKTGVIRKEKEFVRMLGPQGRKLDDLGDPSDLIDVLHKSLLLWEKGQRAEMVQVLAEKGHGKSEAFYRVAQAISETLPLESKEKKLLDGFLAGRERVQEEVEKAAEQGRLFE
jgi:adenine-specific DNA methylase